MQDCKTIRLRAPLGTDEASYDGTRFSVDDEGCIDVPLKIAPAFEHNAAGFVEADPPPLAPALDYTLKLRGGPGASATWGGTTYSVDATGVVTIPAAAWPDLSSHGFRIAAG